MTKTEQAIRYICLEDTDDEDTMQRRYKKIEAIIHGDDDLIDKYADKYDKLLSLLCN